MSNCANCDLPFEKKGDRRGYFRFSIENTLPNSDQVARDALNRLTGNSVTPVAKKDLENFYVHLAGRILVIL